MNLVGNLFGSSIGRKILMAVTGLILIGFVIGHLVGNLQVFSHPDKLNGYAHFLRSLGPALWIARIGLLVAVVIHIWAATVLTLESKRARGGEPYGVKTWIQATLSSRYMRWTGVVVLAFLLYHLAHFTLGVVQSDTFKETEALRHYKMTADYHVLGFTVVRAGSEVLDVHRMVLLGFQPLVVAIFYIIAVGLLSLHLLHGMDSLFQTLGWRNARWARSLRTFVMLACAAYFIGSAAIPGAVLTGLLKPVPVTPSVAAHP
ncbi:MAG: succinate dehydrogenase cytochrome b subunit [Undibacterium sp.]|nr:succinate dehydrogenase cytochrome b subunit [Opitutaceae bacterium]